MKTCSKCQTEKPAVAFSKDARRKDGLRSECKVCVKLYRVANKEKISQLRRVYYDANKTRLNAYNRLRSSGFTPELFESLWKFQKGKCACCDAPLDRTKHHGVHADHCHQTKRPRALLCYNCNLLEGLVKKVELTPEQFENRLTAYLSEPPYNFGDLI